MVAVEVLTVISNLTLFLTAFVAWRFGRIFRTFIYFTEAIVSAVYHLCDYSGVCLFSYGTLHNLDFFFAQLLICDCGLYLIDFKRKWYFLEWLMFFISIMGIIVLIITLPGQLYVQAGIVGVLFLIDILYWFIWGVPEYNYYFLTLGLTLIGGSVIFFSFQGQQPALYSYIHSLWHIAGPIGRVFLFYIKPPVSIIENAAMQIGGKAKKQYSLRF